MQEKEYLELKYYSKVVCQKYPHLDYEDILHDAIIDSPKGLLHEIKKKIRALYMDRRLNVRTIKKDRKYGPGETTRVCKKCKEELPIACFYMVVRRRTNTHEILYSCKDCHKKTTHNNAKKNPIPQRRCSKRWEQKKRKINPLWSEKKKEYMRNYQKKNKTKRKEYMKSYYKENKDKILASQKKYRKNQLVAISRD